MNRRLLSFLHAVGSDFTHGLGAALTIVGAAAAVVDWRDNNVGFPGQFYVTTLLIAAAILLARPAYAKVFAAADQDHKAAEQAARIAIQQDAERCVAHEE